MDKSRHFQSRRKLLTQGILSGAMVNVLPSQWTRPIVASVILPAHANISPTECTNLTVPGFTLSCGVDFPNSTIRYEINDVNGSCELTPTGSVGSPTTFSVNRVIDDNLDTRAVLITVGSDFGGIEIRDCTTTPSIATLGPNLLDPVISLSGIPYQIDWTTSGDVNALTISDITVTPVSI